MKVQCLDTVGWVTERTSRLQKTCCSKHWCEKSVCLRQHFLQEGKVFVSIIQEYTFNNSKVQILGDQIQFHILILICEFCHNLQKTMW